MKYVKQMMTVLFSLCLMFVIMLICLLSSLPILLEPKTYQSTLEAVSAYSAIQESIQNSLDDMLLINNIERQTLNEFITVDEVKQVVSQDMDALLAWLTGTGPQLEALDLSCYEARFDKRLALFFRDNNYYLNEAEKQDVEVMKQNALQIIQGNLRVLEWDALTQTEPFTYVPKIIGLLNVKLILIVLMIAGTILMGGLLLMHRKKLTEGLLWSGYGLLAGGLIIFIVFFSGIQSGFYHHIAIQVNYLQESIGLIIGTVFHSLVVSGLIAALIGILFMTPYWVKLYQDMIKDK